MMEWLTVSEAAARLGLTPQAVRKRIARHRGPLPPDWVRRSGGVWLISEKALAAWWGEELEFPSEGDD